MPWVGGREDDRRLRKFLGQALAAALAVRRSSFR